MEPHLTQDEELQRIRHWWKKNGVSVVAGVGIGVAAIAAVNGWQVYTENRAENASALFDQVRTALRADDLDAARGLADELREDFTATTYATGAALLVAARRHRDGDAEGARELLERTLDSGAGDAAEHAARLRLAALELDAGNHERALELTAADDRQGFESFYAELRAEAHLLGGDAGAARAEFDAALDALAEDSGYRELLEMKRNAVAEAD